MKGGGWPLVLLCLSVTCIWSIPTYAHEGESKVSKIYGDSAGLAKEQQAYTGGPKIHDVLRKVESADRGNDGRVTEALFILQSLEPTNARLSRLERSSGILRIFTHYLKEVFYILFMNGPNYDESSDTGQAQKTWGTPLAQAVKLLEAAAKEGNTDARFLLADINFFGFYSHPRNYSKAFQGYYDLAMTTGNSSAQHMVGFMYATGIGGAVQRDQAKALLYHTFAALGGDTRSQMTVAFRYNAGIATPRNCEQASFHYKAVAEKAIQFYESGPPGGRSIIKNAYRLADDEGGVYGEGASVSSSGVHAIKGDVGSNTHAALEDVLEYLDLMSRKDDFKATFSLGRLYYDGSRVLDRNLNKARVYFQRIARKYWDKEGNINSKAPPGIDKIAAKAASYLGRMYLRGEAVKQSYDQAAKWFQRGVANGDSTSQNGMGLLYLHGLGLPKDELKAAEYFRTAADQDHPSAQVNLAKLLLDQGDTYHANSYLELAARHGHIEAFYYLAEIANQGVGRDRSCGVATTYYKIVAEKAEPIHSSFDTANEAYKNGDVEGALVRYMMAAEQGFEAAQANVAYLLDEEKSRLSLDFLLPIRRSRPSFLRNAALALIYWTRSAKQSNMDSMVKMGDYYHAGIGTQADEEKAAACYQAASEFQQSAQALWNLGWMHENGLGVEQDFHLAKRFYDQALETNQEAYLPVSMALLKLRLRSFWNTITNGRVNSIQNEPERKKEWSVSEWVQNFLKDDHTNFPDGDDGDDLTNPVTEPPSSEDDLYLEMDESFLETLLILSLAGTLLFLVYYRQQRRLNHRRLAANRDQAHGDGVPGAQGDNQVDRGLFPLPGDPELNNWVAGGVGH